MLYFVGVIEMKLDNMLQNYEQMKTAIQNLHLEQYDIKYDLDHKQSCHISMNKDIFNLSEKPFLIDINEYHVVRRILNNEQ